VSALHFNTANLCVPLAEAVSAELAARDSVEPSPVRQYERGRELLAQTHSVLRELWGPSEVAVSTWGGATALYRALSLLLRLESGTSGAAGGRPVRVLTSAHEHSGFFESFDRRSGFEPILLKDAECFDPTLFAKRIESEAPDLIALSQVFYDLGWKLPIVDLLSAAERAGHRGFFLVDVAQSAGIVSEMPTLRLRHLGPRTMPVLCVGSLHKWLMSLHGTGFVLSCPEAARRIRAVAHPSGALLAENPLAIFEAGGGQDFARYAGVLAALESYRARDPRNLERVSTERACELWDLIREVLDRHLPGGVRYHSWFGGSAVAGAPEPAHFSREGFRPGPMLTLEFFPALEPGLPSSPVIDVYALYQELAARGQHVKCLIKKAVDGTDLKLLRLSVHERHEPEDLKRFARELDSAMRKIR
jgi:selenocysteine lyase/cysteine desulfurase